MFPVARVKRHLNAWMGWQGKHVADGAAVFLAVLLEYLATKAMELAGNVVRDCRKGATNSNLCGMSTVMMS